MLSRDRLTFFMAALWAPLLLLVSILASDFVGGRYSKLDSDYSEWMYVLWWAFPGTVFLHSGQPGPWPEEANPRCCEWFGSLL